MFGAYIFYNCYISFLDWSLDHHVVSSLVSCNSLYFKVYFGDLANGPVVKNPPSNVGDVGSIPGWGTKISHAVGPLSPRATTTEPVRLN